MSDKSKRTHSFLFINEKQLWLSEITLFICIAILVTIPIYMVSIVINNEIKIRNNNARISSAVTERVSIEYDLEKWQDKYAIFSVLNTFTRGRLKSKLISDLTNIVYDGARQFGYDPFLVLAVINVESMFKTLAMGQYRSGAYSGAFGLMQLKEETAKEVAYKFGIPFNGIEDLMKPEINIALGIGYLTQMITMFKSLKLGILAYNQGPGTILNNLKNRRPLSTQYYTKVLKSYFKLKKVHDKYINDISP